MNESQNKEKKIWNFIQFSEIWENCDTSSIDDISPSWIKYREHFENTSNEYNNFIESLKRQHAIETGIIERMYDISKGATETLIEKGISDTLISHGDYNEDISKEDLIAHLKDNFNAIDMVFEIVKDERPLSVGVIKELHSVLTEHQDHTEGIDVNGRIRKISLLKGEFKKLPNNPSRESNGQRITYQYCPPEHVSAEMDKLISTYNSIVEKKIHPIIVSAWFHHAFSTIHPFQDGNGRIARLLSSLILIKAGFFPVTVIREEAKDRYLKALEEADNNNPQPLVEYFIDLQRRNIERVLNIQTIPLSSSYEEVSDILSKKLRERKDQNNENILEDNKAEIFEFSLALAERLKIDLDRKIGDMITITMSAASPQDTEKGHYFTNQISELAQQNNYFYNRFNSKAHIQIHFSIDKNSHNSKAYKLIITQHNFGYQPDNYAIGAFIIFYEAEERSNISLNIKPYKFSLRTDKNKLPYKNIEKYVNDVFTAALATIANEI